MRHAHEASIRNVIVSADRDARQVLDVWAAGHGLIRQQGRYSQALLTDCAAVGL